jgi:hypothetical protein
MVVSIKKNIKEEQDFPLDCLPEIIAQSIKTVCEAKSLPVQYVASGCLWAASALAGRRYFSEFNGRGKNILYLLWCGPVSMGKTPAFQSTCVDPLKEAYKYSDALYNEKYTEYLESKKSKDKSLILDHPHHFIPITTEGTTEGLIAKHRFQPHGIGVYYDEAESIFSAGNYKGQNDAISFFTQAFAGERFQQVRVDMERERVIEQININVLMGTQTERLGNIFTSDRLASGFAARFLNVQSDYIPLNLDIDPFGASMRMCNEWTQILEFLFYGALNGYSPIEIEITNCGKDAYRKYNRLLMEEANSRILSKAEGYLIGAEAKLSAYLPRLAQVVAIVNNPKQPFINSQIMGFAFRIYRYFQQSSIQAMTKIKTETESGLPTDLENLYKMLPDEFNAKEAAEICHKLGLNNRRFEVSVRKKDFGALFRKMGHGKYQKL